MAYRFKRGVTRRDLPGVFLIFAVIFAVFALGTPFAANLDLAKEGDLQSIEGKVESAPRRTDPEKFGRKLHIFIRASDGVHHLTQDDLSEDVPGIMDLRPGDYVTARVKHDTFGRKLDWLWVLQRDGATVLSYKDTYRYFERWTAAGRELAEWAGVLSFGLFIIAVVLRWTFGRWGAWIDPR